jgi:hypothetical protein
MQRPFRFLGFSAASLPALLCIFASASAKPGFQELLYNPHWYRTFDTSSSIIPAQGTLLFAWNFRDADKAADSFYVGIDTLWGLPQDVQGDTAWDWDLQVCPDEICMNGLKAGIHGANAPYPFEDTNFQAEHHFQFFPAVDSRYNFISPARRVFGGMMYCRSRTSGASDTVFAFGAWGLEWDSAFAPPVRPVAGYLPRPEDFAISGDTVRYVKAGSGIGPESKRLGPEAQGLLARSVPGGIRFSFPQVKAEKELSVFAPDGKTLWVSGRLSADRDELIWNGMAARGSASGPGFWLIRLSWAGGEAWTKAAWLRP